jgi:YggT family protein
MSDVISAALLFLINTVFDLYVYLLAIRVILVWVGANYFDPFTQLVVKFTDVVVKPLRRYVPTVRRVEIASIIIILLIEILKFYADSFLSYVTPVFLGILLLALGDAIKIFLFVFFYAIVLQAILSWMQPYSDVNRLLALFTSPIMRPLHRVIPTVGGFDITPIPALILLQLLIMLCADPLMSTGMRLSLG